MAESFITIMRIKETPKEALIVQQILLFSTNRNIEKSVEIMDTDLMV